MRRCWLKGETGDALHAVLCAAGFNIRWLMRAIVKKGIPPLWQLFLRLQFALHWAIQSAMLAISRLPQTGLRRAFKAPMPATRASDRPKFA